MKTRILIFATLFLLIDKKRVKLVHVYAQADLVEVINLFQWYSLVVDMHTI